MIAREWMPDGLLLPWDHYGYALPSRACLAYAAHRSNDSMYLELLEKYYINIKHDLKRAGHYLNKNVLKDLALQSPAWEGVRQDVESIEEYLDSELGPNTFEEKQHQIISEEIYQRVQKKEPVADLIKEAALLRKSLG